jgi:transposase
MRLLSLRVSSPRADGGDDEQSLLAEQRADGAAEAVFPKSHGKPRVDDPLPGNGLPASRKRGRVLSGIVFINRTGLPWCDAPREYGPPKTLYNRWKQWGDMGVFAQMMED